MGNSATAPVGSFDGLSDDLVRKVLQDLLSPETIAQARLVSRQWNAILEEIKSMSRYRRLAERLAADGPDSTAARRASELVEGEWMCNTLDGIIRWVDAVFSQSWVVPGPSIPAFSDGEQETLAAAREMASWALGQGSAGRPGECAALSFACGRPSDALQLLSAIERFAVPVSDKKDPHFGRLAALEFGSALLCVFLSDRYAYEFSQQAYALFEAMRSMGSWLGERTEEEQEPEQEPGRLRLTDEQRRVVETDVPPGEIMKVIAFAGTGKTAVLVEYIRRRPRMRFLYTCFNRSTVDEMERRTSDLPNVAVRTYHSLAYQTVGCLFQGKLITKGSLTATEIKNFLFRGQGGGRPEQKRQWQRAGFVRDLLVTFTSSADREIGSQHLPPEAAERPDRDEILENAQRYWARMADPSDLEVKATHDTYFKLWQLSGEDGGAPQILDQQGRPYDCILLDEAQDSNPCFAHVFMNQEAARIAVGDPHQQIYGFRLSIDALSHMEAWRTLHLTRSFRFGDAVAAFASLPLRRFKREIYPVQGRPGGMPGIVLAPKKIVELDALQWRPVDVPFTYIGRSNAGLFKMASRLAMTNPDTRLFFLGRAGSDGSSVVNALMRDVLDVYLIKKGEHWTVKREGHAKFKRFESFKELEAFAEDSQDIEILRAIQVVKEHGDAIPNMVERVKSAVVSCEEEADVTLTTVHQAKGREFERVVLANDFMPCFEARLTREEEATGSRARLRSPQEIGRDPTHREEINHLYVAATRAKSVLVASWSLHNLATRPLAFSLRLGTAPAASCKLCWSRPAAEPAPVPPSRAALHVAACGHDELVESRGRVPLQGGEPVGACGACPCPSTHAPELARCLEAYMVSGVQPAPPPLPKPAPPTPSRSKQLFLAAVALTVDSSQAGPSASAPGTTAKPRRRRRAEGGPAHEDQVQDVNEKPCRGKKRLSF